MTEYKYDKLYLILARNITDYTDAATEIDWNEWTPIEQLQRLDVPKANEELIALEKPIKFQHK